MGPTLEALRFPWVVSVSYCCIRNHPKHNGLQTTPFVSKIPTYDAVGEEFSQRSVEKAHLCSMGCQLDGWPGAGGPLWSRSCV